MRENVNTTKIKSTLVYQKEMQVQINVQVGEFHRTNKRAVLSKHAGKGDILYPDSSHITFE